MDEREHSEEKDGATEDLFKTIAGSLETNVLGKRIGGFHVKRVIAAGGMGVVYEATQTNPRRTVALKIMKQGIASRNALRRFQYEAQILARLRHPGIAEIYQAGIHEEEIPGHGKIVEPYFSMEYIPNAKSIVDYANAHQLSTHARLELFAKVCEAVHHGHQKGIIHRDLKPSNILVDSSGQPKVIDFGVARSTDSDMAVTTLQTDVGRLIGTLQYMSPEQCDADPHDLDTRSDVYSLGIILYELLCGRLPYNVSGTAVFEAARRIREESPPKPSAINRMLRGDIETIVLTAQDKDRNRRYQSAAELAQDINRYLNNEPILAHAPSLAYQIRMFARRNRTVFFALAAVSATLVAATVISVIFGVRAGMARDSEQKQRVAAENAEMEAETARDTAEVEKQKAVTAFENLQESNYTANIRLADHYIKTDYSFLARNCLELCDTGLRNWEWHYLNALTDTSLLTLRAHPGGVPCVTVSPDGKWIISGGRDRIIKIWNAQSGEEVRTLKGHKDWVTSVAVSPDGRRIISGSADKTIKIWDAESGEEVRTLRGHEGGVSSVAVSPDGKRIVSGSGDKTIKVWDVESGEGLKTLRGHEKGVKSVAVSADGKRIVSGSSDKTIKIWDAESGEEVRTLKGHEDEVSSVAISSDNRIISGSWDETVKIWDAESGEEPRTLRGHQSLVTAVAVSPDGRRIISGDGYNCAIKIWDAESGEELRTLRGHTLWVQSIAVSPDGQRIVSSGDDTVKIWGVESNQEGRILSGHKDGVASVAVSPDGKRIVSGSSDKTIKIWDTESGEELRTLNGHEGRVTCVAISSDGKRIISGSEDKTIKIWDAESGEEVRTLTGHEGRVTCVVISSDGKRIISSGGDGIIKIWDAGSGEELRTLRGHGGAVPSVAVSPDGQRIVSGSWDSTVRIWDVESGKELKIFRGYGGPVNAVAISPDGKRIVVGGWHLRKVMKIWDAESGRELGSLRGHADAMLCIAVSRDGKRIISSSGDKTIKIWDGEAGAELLTLSEYGTYANCVAMSPDGSTIVGGYEDGSIFVWKAEVVDYDMWDTEAPSIYDWSVSNDEAGKVTVELTASDNTGVARVRLEYVANSENYDREKWLGWQGGEVWSCTLDDTFSNNDQVYLRAWAEDKSPRANTTTADCSSNPYVVSIGR